MPQASGKYHNQADGEIQDSGDDVESPFIPMFRTKSSRIIDRRRSVCTLCIVLAGVSLLSFGAILFAKPLKYLNAEDPPAYPDILSSQLYLQGSPTQSFRGQLNHQRPPHRLITTASDNLRNDTKYITSWVSAGWSTSTQHCLSAAILTTITC